MQNAASSTPEFSMGATPILSSHHNHCDDLFVAAEAAAHTGKWIECRETFQQFHREMTAHFATEEEVLFPAFEAVSGSVDGPTRMMRLEHAQIRSLMNAAAKSAAASNADGFAGAAETLLIMMQQHNMKEENILYPMCDRALDVRALAIDQELATRIEVPCPT
jgi:iron-sulfur cluster repair protein YtfE (RIC family)